MTIQNSQNVTGQSLPQELGKIRDSCDFKENTSPNSKHDQLWFI